jgi:hypothetical protein
MTTRGPTTQTVESTTVKSTTVATTKEVLTTKTVISTTAPGKLSKKLSIIFDYYNEFDHVVSIQ